MKTKLIEWLVGRTIISGGNNLLLVKNSPGLSIFSKRAPLTLQNFYIYGLGGNLKKKITDSMFVLKYIWVG